VCASRHRMGPQSATDSDRMSRLGPKQGSTAALAPLVYLLAGCAHGDQPGTTAGAAGVVDGGSDTRGSAQDGGPLELAFRYTEPSPLRGNPDPTAGVGFFDACVPGQALVGFSGKLSALATAAGPSDVIAQIAGLCGAPTIAVVDGQYSVRIADGGVLPARGALGDTDWTRRCPANHVVVGFDSRSGALLDELAFLCAPLAVGPEPRIVVGEPVPVEPVGGQGGAINEVSACSPGNFATASAGRAGDLLDSFQLGCGHALFK
jgi:hypothetical protein